jgi:hypothetical protein
MRATAARRSFVGWAHILGIIVTLPHYETVSDNDSHGTRCHQAEGLEYFLPPPVDKVVLTNNLGNPSLAKYFAGCTNVKAGLRFSIHEPCADFAASHATSLLAPQVFLTPRIIEVPIAFGKTTKTSLLP